MVKADQCVYGLLTPSVADMSVMASALKPIKFRTDSEIMFHQMSKHCAKDHVHQRGRKIQRCNNDPSAIGTSYSPRDCIALKEEAIHGT